MTISNWISSDLVYLYHIKMPLKESNYPEWHFYVISDYLVSFLRSKLTKVKRLAKPSAKRPKIET